MKYTNIKTTTVIIILTVSVLSFAGCLDDDNDPAVEMNVLDVDVREGFGVIEPVDELWIEVEIKNLCEDDLTIWNSDFDIVCEDGQVHRVTSGDIELGGRTITSGGTTSFWLDCGNIEDSVMETLRYHHEEEVFEEVIPSYE